MPTLKHILCAAALIGLPLGVPAAFADEAAPAPKASQAPSSGRSAPHFVESEDGMVRVTLGTLRDVGLGLAQIKQQAKNIYVEATRLPVPMLAGPELPQLTAVPRADRLRSGGYLAPRREWIFYYIGTMEPLIHNMQSSQDEAEETIHKVMVIPSGSRSSVVPIAEEWDKIVAKMSGHLDDLAALIEDAPNNNVPIAKQAVLLYEDTDMLEALRRKLYRVVQSAERKNPGATSTL